MDCKPSAMQYRLRMGSYFACACWGKEWVVSKGLVPFWRPLLPDGMFEVMIVRAPRRSIKVAGRYTANSEFSVVRERIVIILMLLCNVHTYMPRTVQVSIHSSPSVLLCRPAGQLAIIMLSHDVSRRVAFLVCSPRLHLFPATTYGYMPHEVR